jgi:hypothetical protein
MSDPASQARQNYEVVKGVVSANQGEFIHVRAADGRTAGFTVKGPAASRIGPGIPVGIVALRGSDKAVHLVNRATGERFDLSIWHDHSRRGPSKGGTAFRVLVFAILLIPVVGQLAMLSGAVGAIVGGLIVSSSMKGHVGASIPRVLLAVAVYAVGSFLFFSGWFGGTHGLVVLGFVIMAVGALAWTFWVNRPAIQYYVEVNKLMDEAAA